jgi:hypothetical protein
MQSRKRPTDAHRHQKPCDKLSKIDYGIATAFRSEIIWIRTSSTNPVRDGRKHVSCDDQKWVVFIPQGAGQNDQKEADRKDLSRRNY